MVKQLFLISLFVYLFNGLFAQQKNYFIYFQSEKNTPFYIKYANKIYSSSAIGYNILSKLPSGEHKVYIGFPKSKEKEIPFLCKIDNNDLGYKIIQSSNELQLLNINELTVIKPFSGNITDVAKPAEPTPVKEIPKKEEPVVPLKEPVVVQVQPVTKLFAKKKTDAGIEAIYVDGYPGKSDTVRIFIPVIAIQKEPGPIEVKEVPQKKDSVADKLVKPAVPVTPPPDKKFLDFEVKNDPPVRQEPKEPVNSNPVSTPKDTLTKSKLVLVNSDCPKIADNEDYVALRKKMAGKTNDEDMLFEAFKAFKKKCYLTEQVKGLGVLLSSDENRYKLYDMAYARVYDTEAFRGLVNTLTDKYYINRFNALVNR